MSQFRSIRRRLVTGFTLLTLLTVLLLGVLVFGLMQRYIARQESAYLQQNATAIAQQSALMLPAPAPPVELASLARTAALLGNFRVKILDAEQEVIIDSALPRAQDHVIWNTSLRPVGRPGQMTWDEDVLIIDTANNEIALDEQRVAPFVLRWGEVRERRLDDAYPTARAQSIPYQIRVIRQNHGEWGPLLAFERAVLPSFSPTSPPITSATITMSELLTATNATPTIQNAPPMDTKLETPALQRVVTPIQADNVIVGYVELSSQPGVAGEALVALRRLFLLVGGAVSLVAVGVGLVMSRSFTAPLQTLTEATQRMNGGDLSTRAAVQSNDEIGLLARAFNRMATALEKNFADLAAERDALRTFIGDASHELRTPITALRTFNDLLQDSAAHDPAAQAEFLAESTLQLRRLERITENLLNLSRLEGGLVELQISSVAVASLCDDVVTLLIPLANERNSQVTVVPIDPTLTIRGDREQLERALVNVVENALKFTQAEGLVELGAMAIDESARVALWVRDNGPGIEPPDQLRIFQRFYRGRTATNGGSGLGLAIVQSIVQAHGGTVDVESEVGVGTLVTVKLPTPAQTEQKMIFQA